LLGLSARGQSLEAGEKAIVSERPVNLSAVYWVSP
jgi:hypothetical protein